MAVHHSAYKKPRYISTAHFARLNIIQSLNFLLPYRLNIKINNV